MTSLQSVFRSSLYFLLTLDIHLFHLCLSSSLSRSSRRILPILASFLTFLRVFLYSLYAIYFLLSLVALLSSPFSLKTLSPRTWMITISSGWPVLLLCELIRNSKILRITVHQFEFPLQTRIENYLLARLHIY